MALSGMAKPGLDLEQRSFLNGDAARSPHKQVFENQIYVARGNSLGPGGSERAAGPHLHVPNDRLGARVYHAKDNVS